MAAEIKKEIELEIAHVLFLDIVGYSKLSVNEQHARVDELNQIVRASEQFQKAEVANRILKIPTGDGMALVFYKVPRNRRTDRGHGHPLLDEGERGGLLSKTHIGQREITKKTC